MSLIQRIWLIILFLLVLAFGSSLVISYTALRHHVEETLRLKNADNVQALALTMTQMNKDPVVLELLLSAQFDTGHYKLISLVSNDGSVSIVRKSDASISGAPAWFVSLIDLHIPAGVATVQDGWQQFGTLKVASQYQYAYRTLWTSARNLFLSFIVVTLLSLLLAYIIVRGIRKPLNAVVEQARQIGNRRFRTLKEPRIRELRDVVSSMNQLSHSVHQMLADESSHLEQLQARIRFDEVTGLNNREYFLNHLDGLLHRQDALASGMFAIVRLPDLAELNTQLGYAETNTLLLTISRQLQTLEQSWDNAFTGRLNGSDFGLIIPGSQQTDILSRALSKILTELPDTIAVPPTLPASLITYGPNDSQSSILAALDTALATAENRADGQIEIADNTAATQLFDTREAMHAALIEALDTRALRFNHYPVVAPDNTLLHEESPSRLYLAGEWRSAAVFVPWITRFGMTAAFDLQVIDTALSESRSHGKPIAVNLSAQTLTQRSFLDALWCRLTARKAADRLLLEWPAAGALANRKAFEQLTNQLTRYGYKIGLKHAGHELAQIAELHDLGLDRVKIDAALIRDIHLQTEQQSYVRGLCTLLHSLGITVIAEGVQSQEEMAALTDLGLDGFTGPGISYPDADQ